MYVNEAMSTSVQTCSPSTSLDDIARMMWEEDCGAIPVVNDARHPLGIVTDRDIAMSAMLNHQPLWELNAEQVIREQRPCTSRQGETLEDCLGRMEQNRIRRMLVVDDGGALVGILSMGDALAATQPEARRKGPRIGIEPVLGMLRKVSAHHANGSKPVARLQ